jgi:hypothetical protein
MWKHGQGMLMRLGRKKKFAWKEYFMRSTEPDEHPPLSPIYTWTKEDQEYLDQITKRNLKLVIQEHMAALGTSTTGSQYSPGSFVDPDIEEALTRLEERVGLTESRIEPIKNCRKCYFATSTRVLNTMWYCFCTNRAPARFVTARGNLPCWRKKESDL